MATTYAKPFQTISQQIALLKGRGLDVGSNSYAESLLTQFGYYRLSGYWHPLRQAQYDLSAAGVVYQEQFKSGATLAQALALAEFDRRLRALFLEAIERIEVGIRVRVALLFGPRGGLSHRDAAQYYPKFTNIVDANTGETGFKWWIRRVDDHEERSKEQSPCTFGRNTDCRSPSG